MTFVPSPEDIYAEGNMKRIIIESLIFVEITTTIIDHELLHLSNKRLEGY